MALSDADLKLMQPERRGKGGGGRMSANVVPYSQSNGLFADIPQLGFWAGRFDLVKTYGFVDALNADGLSGAFFVLTEVPDDPAIQFLLAATRNWFDFEDAIKAELSAYLDQGAPIPGAIYGTAGAGQRFVQYWQYPNTHTAKVGTTYVLVGNPGQSTEFRDWVLATDVTVETRQFWDESSKTYYTRDVVTITGALPLSHSYVGRDVSINMPAAPQAVICDTLVSDRVQFHGCAPLAAEAQAGDLALFLERTTFQVVPASVSESFTGDLDGAGNNLVAIPSAAGTLSLAVGTDLGPGLSLHIGPFQPGSFSLAAGAATLTDSGGQLLSGSTVVGTANPLLGIIQFAAGSPTYSGPKTAAWRPAGVVTAPQHSVSILITQGNQGKAYSKNLYPPPVKGSVRCRYQSGGNIYTLDDDGAGTLRGAVPAVGGGTVSPSGSVNVVLGAPPDVGSELVFTWSVAAYTVSHGGAAVAPAAIEITTTAPFGPGQLTLSWNDGVPRTAADDGLGHLTGDATGDCSYANRTILLRPAVLPPKGTVITVNIVPRAQVTESLGAPSRDSSGNVSIDLMHGNIVPGSIQLDIAYTAVPAPASVSIPNVSVAATMPFTGFIPRLSAMG